MIKVLRVDKSNFHKIKAYKDICLFHYVIFRFKINKHEFKEVERKETKEIYLKKEKKYYPGQLFENYIKYILFYPDDTIEVLSESKFNEKKDSIEYSLIQNDDTDLIINN